MMTLEEARAIFAKDIYATETTGIRIDAVESDHAECSMKITEKHLAAHNGVMGGAIFTLADFCFAVASNADGRLTVTTSSMINYIGRAKGTVLVARCELVKSGSRTCLYTTTVRDELGNLVAQVTSNGMHV